MVFQFVSFHDTFNFFGDRASALGYRKASVETSEGNCGESWARYGVLETRWSAGEMEGWWWIVTVHVVSVVTLPPTEQEPARTLSLGFLQASSYLTLSRAAETQPG